MVVVDYVGIETQGNCEVRRASSAMTLSLHRSLSRLATVSLISRHRGWALLIARVLLTVRSGYYVP